MKYIYRLRLIGDENGEYEFDLDIAKFSIIREDENNYAFKLFDGTDCFIPKSRLNEVTEDTCELDDFYTDDLEKGKKIFSKILSYRICVYREIIENKEMVFAALNKLISKLEGK